MIEKVMNYFGWYKVDNELTEEWIKQFIENDAQQVVATQNTTSQWEEYCQEAA